MEIIMMVLGIVLMCFGSAGVVASYLSPEPMKTFLFSLFTIACGLGAVVLCLL
jgi:hypothetical protein